MRLSSRRNFSLLRERERRVREGEGEKKKELRRKEGNKERFASHDGNISVAREKR